MFIYILFFSISFLLVFVSYIIGKTHGFDLGVRYCIEKFDAVIKKNKD